MKSYSSIISNIKSIFIAVFIAILIRSFIEAYRHMPLYNPVNLYTTAPIIVINIVPFIMGKKIYELANEPKNFYFSEYDNHKMDYDKNLLSALKKFILSLN